MPEINETQLKNQIKERKFSQSYLIYGNEPYLKQHYAGLIAKKCVAEGMEGFNLREFDSENANDIQELIDSTDTLPVFSDYCCTLIKDFPLAAMYSSDKKRFEAWIKDMPDTTVAVFRQDSDDINPKKDAKWKSVISLFSKYGSVLRFDRLDRTSLSKTVIGGLKKRGAEIDRDTAFYLIDTVGSDLNILLNEVEKLASFTLGGTVTREDIDKICIKSLESNIFDLSKSLFSKNPKRSFEILDKLLKDKERPEMILGALAGNFIDVYRAKASVASGESADYLQDIYNYKNTGFRLRNAARDAYGLDIPRARKCIALLSEADSRIKMRVIDERTVLERLITELYYVINGGEAL